MNHRRITVALVAALALVLAACGEAEQQEGADGFPSGEETGGEVTMARATWDTGWFQAEIYRQLLSELGYSPTDPADFTRNANGFYPALARGEVDMWANGWFPLHDRYLSGELVTGQQVSEPIEPIGFEVRAGALQGFLIDKATADEMGITSMADFADPAVAEVFDTDGNGQADLYGCNEGWGCNLAIDERIAENDWGANVEQVVASYSDLISDEVVPRVEAGEPVLFYTWTPNWTVDVLVPGEDVVWLEAPGLEAEEGSTAVEGLEGCAGDADPCDLGWLVNDIRAVANRDFLDANPPIRRLLQVVEIPLDDIAAQNAEMQATDDYGSSDLTEDAEAWIEENRDLVDSWLDTARG